VAWLVVVATPQPAIKAPSANVSVSLIGVDGFLKVDMMPIFLLLLWETS
jgi:hypothetical protein